MITVLNTGGRSAPKPIPPNPEITLQPGDKKIDVTWTIPESPEVEIKEYNIYLSETEPTELCEMALQDTTETTSFSITELTNDKTYYVVVTSVSVQGKENKSVEGVRSTRTRSTLFMITQIINSFSTGITSYAHASEDSIKWNSKGTISSGYEPYAMVYGDNQFVSVGKQGRSYSSADGGYWVALDIVSSNYFLNSIAYGNNNFVAVNGTAAVATFSTQYRLAGSTKWVAGQNFSGMGYHNITFTNDRFIAVTLAAGRIHVSADGITWVAMNGPDSNKLSNVVFGLGKYWCATSTSIYYSNDLNTWVATASSKSLGVTYDYKDLVYSNGLQRLILMSGSKPFYSDDGTSWSGTTVGVDSYNCNAIVCTDNTIIFSSSAANTGKTTVWRSSTGKSWINVTDGIVFSSYSSLAVRA